MRKTIISNRIPAPIGPYSPGVQVGNIVFLSGQIPLDSQTMKLVSNDFRAQAIQVMEHIKTLTQAAGGDLNDIVKLTIYLTDLKHFSVLAEVLTEFLQEPYPARSTIQVSALPREALIEIEAIMAPPAQ